MNQCKHCCGTGQGNDGSHFLQEDCRHCSGSGVNDSSKMKLKARIKELEDAIIPLLQMKRDFLDSDLSYSDAYNCFWEGCYRDWNTAEMVMAKTKEGAKP